MNRFRQGFWLSLAAAAAALLVPLFVWSRMHAAALPPKPEFPAPGRSFVAEYGGQGAYVAHLLYGWGLFGFGGRIRQADIILLGSSHMQFGLSARDIGADLSRTAGRPIRVFNAGLGCDTPLSFDAALLDRLGIEERTIVADAFAYDFDPYTYACFSDFAGISDRVQAGFKVLAIWSRFDWDWLLDGALPRLDLRGGQARLGRYLNAAATILDWRTGDAAYLYSPDTGEQFPDLAAGQAQAVASGLPWRLGAGSVPVPGALDTVARRRQLRPVFTLIPYVLLPGFNRDRYAGVAQSLAAKASGPRAPFLAIAPDGLASFDTQHLTGASRAAASARFAAALTAAGLAP